MEAVENELNKSIKRHLESGKYNLISKTVKTKSNTYECLSVSADEWKTWKAAKNETSEKKEGREKKDNM